MVGKGSEQIYGETVHLLDLIVGNPSLFPASLKKSGLRKAVLSKQTTIFYKIEGKTIHLVYIHLNKKKI